MFKRGITFSVLYALFHSYIDAVSLKMALILTLSTCSLGSHGNQLSPILPDHRHDSLLLPHWASYHDHLSPTGVVRKIIACREGSLHKRNIDDESLQSDCSPFITFVVRSAKRAKLHDTFHDTLRSWKSPNGLFIDPRENNNVAIQHASYQGHISDVKSLLSWRGPAGEFVDPRADDNFALRWACRLGHHEVVNELLAWKGPKGEWVDPRAGYNYAVQMASKNGQFEVVKALLEWKGPAGEWVDPRMLDNYAVRLAIENKHLQVFLLLAAWQSPNHEYCKLDLSGSGW